MPSILAKYIDCRIHGRSVNPTPWENRLVHFVDRLFAAIRRVGNPVVVGIDPRPEELPPGFLERFPGDRDGVSERFDLASAAR